MDIASLATAAVAALVPVLVKGTGEIAAGALKDLYAAIKKRLLSSDDKEKTAAIEANPAEHKPELEQLAKAVLEQEPTLASRVQEHFLQQQTISGSLVGSVEAEKSVVAGQIGNLNM